MLFGNLFSRTKPRGLTWTPRYFDPKDFDPEDDEQFQEMRRQTRIQFERLRSRSTKGKRRRAANPFMLLAFVVLIGAVIWTAQRTADFANVSDVEIAPDAAVEPGPPVRRSPANTLIIERDTVRVGGEEDSIAVE